MDIALMHRSSSITSVGAYGGIGRGQSYHIGWVLL